MKWRKEPVPPIEVDTLDQKLLFDILAEQRQQTKDIKDLRMMATFFGILMILSAMAGCLWIVFGSTLF